ADDRRNPRRRPRPVGAYFAQSCGGRRMTSMSEALLHLSRRMPRVVREHEVLRVAGRMLRDKASEAADAAIDEVLKWAERRCGGRLPSEAWRRDTFEYFSGGRNSSCVRLKSESSDLWAIR